MSEPRHGEMVYWRFKSSSPTPWKFGYATDTESRGLMRMGHWNGDTTGGPVVSVSEIEWREYRAWP